MRKFLPNPVTSGPDGAVLVHYGRYHKDAIDFAFHDIGGPERLADEAHKDPKWFYEKLWVKRLPKEVEVSANEGMEELLRRLDAGEHAQIINPGEDE
jgi:hypothetical protein